MKRSEINSLVRSASVCFSKNGWHLPPEPKWDVTDFGLGDWRRYGLVLVNLCEEPEYCEKLMYAQLGMTTPTHLHNKKKEDIIVRSGSLEITFFADNEMTDGPPLTIQRNGVATLVERGDPIRLDSGERVTIMPGVAHVFTAASEEAILGEVSTANDDLHDNFFANPQVGRFSDIEEDESPLVRLVSDR